MQNVTSPPVNRVVNDKKPVNKRKIRSDLDKEDNVLTSQLVIKKRRLEIIDTDIKSNTEKLRAIKKEKGHFSPRNVNKREKRSLDKLSEIQNQIQTQSSNKDLCEKIIILKHDKIKVQKQKSRLTLEQTKCVKCVPKDMTIKDLKERICFLEDKILKQTSAVSLADLKSKDGSYSPDLKLCVLSLLRHEVSTANCRTAIQDVARYLFGVHIDSKDLPCATTCANFAHEGSEIIKNVCATELQNESWSAGKDGTLRFQQKLLGGIVKTSAGNEYILGFSRVDSETGAAIAEEVISKVADLAVHTDLASEDYQTAVAGKFKFLKWAMILDLLRNLFNVCGVVI